MRKVTCVVGLAVVLGVAYSFDLHVLPGLQNAVGEFNPAPSLWVEAVAHLAIALLLVGLGWLVFLWSEPSRVVGLIYAVVGAALLLAWPESVSFHIKSRASPRSTCDSPLARTACSISSPRS